MNTTANGNKELVDAICHSLENNVEEWNLIQLGSGRSYTKKTPDGITTGFTLTILTFDKYGSGISKLALRPWATDDDMEALAISVEKHNAKRITMASRKLRADSKKQAESIFLPKDKNVKG